MRSWQAGSVEIEMDMCWPRTKVLQMHGLAMEPLIRRLALRPGGTIGICIAASTNSTPLVTAC